MSTPNNPYAQDSSSIPQFQASGQYQQPVPGQYPQAAVPAQGKSWMAALLLAIFLGSLGVADFYLGYVKIGIAKLGLWILGLILFVIGIGSTFTDAVEVANAGADPESIGIVLSPMMIAGELLWMAAGVWALVTIIMVAARKSMYATDAKGNQLH